MRSPPGGGAGPADPGFLLPFGHRHSLLWSSFARWGTQPPSRSAHRQPLPAGPQRGCRVAHEQDTTGQGAPLIPGTVVRSRPAITLRPAPAALPRPVPTAPLEHPTCGVNLHETSSGVHLRSPITPGRLAAAQGQETLPLPAGLLLACRPRMGQGPLRLLPRASHPAVTRGARRGGDGPTRTGPGNTPPASAGPPTAPPT
jgi:hypothetical protein